MHRGKNEGGGKCEGRGGDGKWMKRRGKERRGV